MLPKLMKWGPPSRSWRSLGGMATAEVSAGGEGVCRGQDPPFCPPGSHSCLQAKPLPAGKDALTNHAAFITCDEQGRAALKQNFKNISTERR